MSITFTEDNEVVITYDNSLNAQFIEPLPDDASQKCAWCRYDSAVAIYAIRGGYGDPLLSPVCQDEVNYLLASPLVTDTRINAS